MRLRTVAATAALAAAAPLTLSGVAIAQPDQDCADFSSQAEAQETFDRDPSDPFRLDADEDRLACEALNGAEESDDTDASEDQGAADDAAEDQDAGEAPAGAVDTGRGGAADDPADVAPALVVAAGLGLAVGGTVLVRRTRASARAGTDTEA